MGISPLSRSVATNFSLAPLSQAWKNQHTRRRHRRCRRAQKHTLSRRQESSFRRQLRLFLNDGIGESRPDLQALAERLVRCRTPEELAWVLDYEVGLAFPGHRSRHQRQEDCDCNEYVATYLWESVGRYRFRKTHAGMDWESWVASHLDF